MQAKTKPTEIPYSDDPKDLVRWREYLGVSQVQLAKESKVVQPTISAIEHGALPFRGGAKEKLWAAIQRLNYKHAQRAAKTTLAALKANQESFKEFIVKEFGANATIETQKSLIEGLQRENALLRQQVEDDRKIIDLLQDSETMRQALALIGRVETLEKDNADLKRLVGLKSEEVHLESEVEARAKKEGE